MGALTLRHFTDAVEPGRPLIALLPERVERRFDRMTSVEVLASGLVAALREIQAHGPYHLAGHSFGGLLAYEVAAQLAAAGDEVGFLALLDVRTPALTDRHLRQHMSLGGRLRRQRQRGLAGATVKTVEVLRRETGRLLGRLGTIPLAPMGTYQFDREGAIHLTRRYRPAGHAIPMTIFTTEAAEIDCADPWLGWRQVHRGPVQRRRAPGDHLTMLQQPSVALVASELGKILSSAAHLHASTEVAS
jgi:thioesterase domain-containing protein